MSINKLQKLFEEQFESPEIMEETILISSDDDDVLFLSDRKVTKQSQMGELPMLVPKIHHKWDACTSVFGKSSFPCTQMGKIFDNIHGENPLPNGTENLSSFETYKSVENKIVSLVREIKENIIVGKGLNIDRKVTDGESRSEVFKEISSGLSNSSNASDLISSSSGDFGFYQKPVEPIFIGGEHPAIILAQKEDFKHRDIVYIPPKGILNERREPTENTSNDQPIITGWTSDSSLNSDSASSPHPNVTLKNSRILDGLIKR